MEDENIKQMADAIAKRTVLNVSNESKKGFPSILRRKDVETFCYITNTYFILAFVDPAEKRGIEKLGKIHIHPFPGLIKENNTMGAAFLIQKSRNVVLDGNTVENLCSFSLGKDATLIVQNHTQVINTRELGPYSYTIDLAYIISFGDEITKDQVLDTLGNLIAYSLKSWDRAVQ